MKKVICWGSFDILHNGHKEFLKDAKRYGDYLIVVVVSDQAIFENKKKLPVNNQEKRVENLKKLNIAHEIVYGKEFLEDSLEFIGSLKPDIIVFGYDQKTEIEKRLIIFLESKGIYPEYQYSKEFSGGIHSSHLRNKLKT